MSYKTEKVFKTLKKNIIIYLILWLIIAIVLIAPVTYTFVNTNKNGKLNTGGFIEQIGPAILDFTTITEMFNEKYVKSFMQTMGVYTLGYAIIIGYSISKVLPLNSFMFLFTFTLPFLSNSNNGLDVFSTFLCNLT